MSVTVKYLDKLFSINFTFEKHIRARTSDII